VTALIDTGITGVVALSVVKIASLKLTAASGRMVRLGDGSTRQVELFDAEVEWCGSWRPVLVYATGRDPLIGMRLLAGHELRIDVKPGGAVGITPLP
jgi:predicted aspartyl protease